jgi:hypothetical protein
VNKQIIVNDFDIFLVCCQATKTKSKNKSRTHIAHKTEVVLYLTATAAAVMAREARHSTIRAALVT